MMERWVVSGERGVVVVAVVVAMIMMWSEASAPTSLVGVSVPASDYSIAVRLKKEYRIPWALGIHRIRVLDANPELVSALSSSDVVLNLTIEDEESILGIAADKAKACRWLHSMLAASNHRVKITTVSIGSSRLLDKSPELGDTLLRALNNMRSAVDDIGLVGVAVTTSHTYDVVRGLFPPSAATFEDEVLPQMVRVLDFLNRTQAPFQIELYPFQVYTERMWPRLGIEYAMFEIGSEDEDAATDPVTGLRYLSMLDMMMDSVVTAIGKVGFRDIPLEVSGTGWPWQVPGRFGAAAASHLRTCEYAARLIISYNSRPGTPLRPYHPTPVYINGLIDDRTNFKGSEAASQFLSYMGLLNAADLLPRCRKLRFDSNTTTYDAAAATTTTPVLLFFPLLLSLLFSPY